jgi:hypothetical protein
MDRQVLRRIQTVNGISKKEAQHLIEEAAILFVSIQSKMAGVPYRVALRYSFHLEKLN